MSQRDDRREPRETTVDDGVNATVSRRSRPSELSALFDGTLAGVADPYPAYARLRAEDPIHRRPHGLWVLTRYADIAAVLRDPRFGREGFERHFAPDIGASADAGGSRQSSSSGTRPTTHAFATR